MKSEEWRAIIEFTGYEISSFGRVRSFVKRKRRSSGYGTESFISRTDPKILKTFIGSHGYHQVSFRNKDSRKCLGRLVHLLVLDSFSGMRPDGMEARHLDGNRSNNYSSNLTWGTIRENTKDKIKHGTIPRGSTHSGSKLSDKDVIEIRRLVKTTLSTYEDIAVNFGVALSTIARIGSRVGWTHIIDDIKTTVIRTNRGPKYLTEYRVALTGKSVIELHGEALTIEVWAKRIGMHKSSIINRLNSGIEPHVALTTPSRKKINGDKE